VLVTGAERRPLAFRLERGEIAAIDAELQSVWQGHSLAEVRALARAL
jgi:hypothetical protein